MTHHFSNVPTIGGSELLSQFDPPYKNSQPRWEGDHQAPDPTKFREVPYELGTQNNSLEGVRLYFHREPRRAVGLWHRLESKTVSLPSVSS